jgi:phospholipid/cholesterol/gamma-HCH transport system substrate-binding protein
LHRVDRALANVEEITEKVNSGKGTLGKLVNDEETVVELNKAVSGVNQFLGNANKIQTNVDVRSEYLSDANLFKSYASIKIQPGLNRYYELGVVMDPKGVVETTQTQTSNNPGGPTASDPTTTEKKTYKNRVKFTGLYAMNFYDFTVKGGLIESSGGAGVDYYLMRRKLRFSFEAFDVKDSTVRLRSSLRYSFIKGLYVTGDGVPVHRRVSGACQARQKQR